VFPQLSDVGADGTPAGRAGPGWLTRSGYAARTDG
jgi:hypothetical protein